MLENLKLSYHLVCWF